MHSSIAISPFVLIISGIAIKPVGYFEQLQTEAQIKAYAQHKHEQTQNMFLFLVNFLILFFSVKKSFLCAIL